MAHTVRGSALGICTKCRRMQSCFQTPAGLEWLGVRKGMGSSMKSGTCQKRVLAIGLIVLGFPMLPLMRGAERGDKEFINFNDPAITSQFRTSGCKLEFLPPSGDKRGALKVVADGSGPAKIKLFAKADRAWNWSAYSALGVELENPTNQLLHFSIAIIEAGGKNPRSAGNSGQLSAMSQFALAVPFGSALPMAYGMRGGPPFGGFIPPPLTAMFPIDDTKVAAVEIELQEAQPGRTMLLSRLVLLPTVSYDKIVDRFGQYTRSEWPGKIHQEEELVEQRKREETEFKRIPTLPGRDEYGGWSDGPQLPARGFFSTSQQEGKWWLVTPSGHLFLSFGVNAIRTEETATLVTSRESMFSWLPGENDPLARHLVDAANIVYGPVHQGKAFNFYRANLQRKYGDDYEQRFLETAIDRLRCWGFNTIANWSDPRLYSYHKVPYTAAITIDGDYARVSNGIEHQRKMHDPFDPRFREAVRRNVEQQTSAYRNDPMCIGYFVDNEISWGDTDNDLDHFGLAVGALKETVSSPAKKVFIKLLRDRYSSLDALNARWGTGFKTWELSAEGSPPPDLSRAIVRADMAVFLKAFARQYFRVIKECLTETDPHHLYLGCRFAWYTPEAVDAAGEFCDVVSFNIYDERLDPAKLAFTLKLNKPCIIGEFHFGAMDRGMFHTGLVAAHDQEERAQMYAGYVRSVVDHPAFVGCGWYEFMDEPLTGRTYDGENFSIGLVNVTDSPYPELVDAARHVHTEAYRRRAKMQ